MPGGRHQAREPDTANTDENGESFDSLGLRISTVTADEGIDISAFPQE